MSENCTHNCETCSAKCDSAGKKSSLLEEPNKMSDIKNVIAVVSGKGGVGKSTVAVNTAVALARLGYKVGLADADVYGPSVPKMTSTEDYLPDAIRDGEKEVILPLEKYGVKWMSIGYFAKPEQALIWRGPMACNALKQMILQVRWEELDFLLIDMPPGTGDMWKRASTCSATKAWASLSSALSKTWRGSPLPSIRMRNTISSERTAERKWPRNTE